jgi:ABC-type nitrate/sulfonate/bicarbonate transport system ATPase subunit
MTDTVSRSDAGLQRQLPQEGRSSVLALQVDGAEARFGELVALRDCSLELRSGEFLAVVGPNGCGKTTLLRLVAGLVQPTAGRVRVSGRPVVAPGDPEIAICFQQPRLLPWRTTVENVAMPLELAGASAHERRQRAASLLERVGLSEAASRWPAELSGGMAQRAALARALITDPRLLLLDEPFSALDALTREAFNGELQALLRASPRSAVLVTHDIAEAVRLADRVAVMTPRPGRVARSIPVDLPRPRPPMPTSEGMAIADEVRATLEALGPPELEHWAVSA